MADSGLIIFDECHCDAERQKLIDKFRTTLDKFAIQYKYHYYKVGFSATPYEQIKSLYPKVIMYPSPNYYGMAQMFESKTPVIFQAKNLANPSECESLFSEINIYNLYYIIRLPGKKIFEDAVMTNLEFQFKKINSKIDTYIYDMHYKENINLLLNINPTKPTIIYLKDKLRMGEYLNTQYIYLVHDDPNNSFTHTTAQSLIGRCCGYFKHDHKTIIYCDYNKAYQHYEWIKSNYSVKTIPKYTKYIKRNGSVKDICIY